MKSSKSKIKYCIVTIILGILVYMVCCKAYYGKVYLLHGNGSRHEWKIEDLQKAAKDFQVNENGEFVSTSPDPWFLIEEPFSAKTVVIDVDDIGEKRNSQIFYYSDNQELDESYSYYFQLHKGLNYLQIPEGQFNKFRLDLTDISDSSLKINSITIYGSRVVPTLLLAIVIGISLIILKIGYIIIFKKNSFHKKNSVLKNKDIVTDGENYVKKTDLIKEKMLSLVLAFLGMCGVLAEVSVLGQGVVYRDILFLPILFVLYKAYSTYMNRQETKGFYCLTCGLSFLFSLMLIAGDQLDTTNDLSLTGMTLLEICLLAIAIFPILGQITLWLNKIQKSAIIKNGNKRVQIICFIVLSVVWFAGYLAMFPGVYGADAPYWHYEFSNPNVAISSQWSPFYCSIFYCLVALGTQLFDSFNAGFAIFSFVQMAFILFVIWNVLKFFSKRIGDTSVIMVSAFFSFVPTHVILAVSSGQDPVFSACLAMVVIQLLEMIIDAESFWKSKKEVIKLFVWLILSCMVRNNGLYAIAVMLVFIIIFMKKYRKHMTIILVAAIAVVQIYQGPIFDAIGIEKGTALREMLSLPLQQMAYAYNYAYDKLSKNEIAEMQKYVSDEGWCSYEPCISDHVKGQLNVDTTKDNMGDFIKLYFEVFQATPGSYLRATALQTYGLWYPNKVWPDGRTYHPYIEYLCLDTLGLYDSDFTITRTSLFPAYDNLLGTLFGKGDDRSGWGGNLSMAFSNVPVLGMLCRAGIYTWVLIYLFFYGIYRRWKKPFVVIGLEVGIFITVFLSPVIMYRYCAPIIFTAPLFVAIFFLPWKSEKYKLEKE